MNEEEEEWMTEEEPRQGDEGGDLDPEQARQGREEEMNLMVKMLKKFDFGSWDDATSRTSKMPTTTKWVDRAKKDDTGKTFVRCRLVARDLKPSVKDQETTCSRRCHRWKRRKLCSRSLRGCVRIDERKDMTK